MNSIHIVIGPTSSGKSEYAVKLAKKLNGEIISADSRQVYKGFPLASGQVPGKWTKVKNKRLKIKDSRFVYKGVQHYCLDFVSPKRTYSVADFVKDGQKALKDILSRGKTPIICGGTGHYIDALVFGQDLPDVPPNKQFREKMEKFSAEKLFFKLTKLDPHRAKNIDRHNKRRLIRALEIIHHTGKPVPKPSSKYKVVSSKEKESHRVNFSQPSLREDPLKLVHSVSLNDINRLGLHIFSGHQGVTSTFGSRINYKLQPIFHYLKPQKEELFLKIEKRLKQRVKQGMLEEIFRAHKKGVSWKRLEELGLEFRYVSRFLKAISKQRSANNKTEPEYSQQKTKNSLKFGKKPKLLDSKFQILNSKELLFMKSPYFTELLKEHKHYTKRQTTWFKRYNQFTY